MPLPVIFNPTPIVVPGIPEQVIPAVPSQIYPNSFLISLEVSVYDPEHQQQSLTVTFRPYNYAQHLLYPDDSKDQHLFIENIWLEAGRSPIFAEVMGGIIQVASLEFEEWILKQQIAITTDPTALAQLNAALNAVENALGVQPAPPPYDLTVHNVPAFDFKAAKQAGKKVDGVVFRNGSWEIMKE